MTNITQDGETVQAKLNAAYAQGGAELAIKTIQDLMNIHIDRYAMINMKGLVQLVDKVGGITVNNPFDLIFRLKKMNRNTQRKFHQVVKRLMESKPWYTHGCVTKIQKEIMVVKNVNGKLFKKS